MSSNKRVQGNIVIETIGATDTITLRSAAALVGVTIDGDLKVLGNTSTISSTDTEIVDNTIVLNSGETGPGVSLNVSGIEIDRGFVNGVDAPAEQTAGLRFNEGTDAWEIRTAVGGWTDIGTGGGGGISAPQYEKQIIAGTPTVVNTTVPTTAVTAGNATLQVYRNGMLQEENISGGAISTEDFDVTGTNQLTFATALVNADKIIIYSFE